MSDEDETTAVLQAACLRAGLDPEGAQLVRRGENVIYRLRGRIIARIARRGQAAAADREVRIASWLEAHDVAAVRALPDVAQPIEVDGRAVTWWHELTPHRHGTALQVADQLRRLHNLPLPDFDIGRLDPFVRLAERIEAATTLTDADRSWMRERLAELQASYQKLPPGLSHSVVHGDAWIGNVVATDDGQVVFLDLERCSIGPPEWDLVSTAVKVFTLGGISVDDYDKFVNSYGHDVTQWAGFETLRDIREFRLACMAGQVAGENPAHAEEAALRLACLRGEYGPRPWHWTALP